MKVGFVILYVPEVSASVTFYERAFGLVRRFMHESGQYAEMETGATALAFASEDMVSTPCHGFRRNRPEEPAERHTHVERPDQPERAPQCECCGTDPDVQAALAIDAVDLLFDAGRHDVHVLSSFRVAPPRLTVRCDK